MEVKPLENRCRIPVASAVVGRRKRESERSIERGGERKGEVTDVLAVDRWKLHRGIPQGQVEGTRLMSE